MIRKNCVGINGGGSGRRQLEELTTQITKLKLKINNQSDNSADLFSSNSEEDSIKNNKALVLYFCQELAVPKGKLKKHHKKKG